MQVFQLNLPPLNNNLTPFRLMTKPFIHAQDSARSLQSDSQIKRAGTRMSQESKFKALIKVKL